jgi:UDP-glucose 4-epimerase
MRLIVTGGAGYIGSHTVIELLEAGHEVVVLDNLCNSNEISLARVEQITSKSATLVNGDIRNRRLLDSLFRDHRIDAVIHFAGLKAVGESSRMPLEYYDNNVSGTITLCQAMRDAGVFRMVFSSSATVYGAEGRPPYVETMQRGQASNPYGATKAMVEQVLTDLANADKRWSMALLRYFNPIGAHHSGLIGEDPKGIPNNLLPFITQVAVGKLPELSIFGNDYTTPDGTCIRDYLHVVDLAIGHFKALEALERPGVQTYNLGTGKGFSVLEVVRAFEAVSGRTIPFHFAPRREGDLPAFWADAEKAERELDWRAERGLEEMMRDAWRWQSQNPDGYR